MKNNTGVCEWCMNPENVITLYDIIDGVTGSFRRVCFKHLFPGVDPCPYKPYTISIDNDSKTNSPKTVYRVWKSGEDLRKSVTDRCEWFKQNKWFEMEAWKLE